MDMVIVIIVFFLILLGSCPPDKPPIYCPNNSCDYQTCSNFPDAKCVLDNCGQCKRKFIIDETVLTDQCSELSNNTKILNSCIFVIFIPQPGSCTI